MNNTKPTQSHVLHGFNQFELTKNLVNNLSQFKLTPSAKLVMLYLSTCYNPNKVDIYPKQKTIASKIGISERSTVRAIDELVKAGLILKVCNYTNRYKITSKIAQKSPEIEKIFNADNLADTKCKNDTKQDDNLTHHEQIKETKKEQDRKYIVKYAMERGVTNIIPYVNAILKAGNYAGIIKKYKDIEKAQEQAEIRRQLTERQVKQNKEDAKTATSPLEFSKDKAIEFVNKMPSYLRKSSIFAQEIIKKYNIKV